MIVFVIINGKKRIWEWLLIGKNVGHLRTQHCKSTLKLLVFSWLILYYIFVGWNNREISCWTMIGTIPLFTKKRLNIYSPVNRDIYIAHGTNYHFCHFSNNWTFMFISHLLQTGSQKLVWINLYTSTGRLQNDFDYDYDCHCHCYCDYDVLVPGQQAVKRFGEFPLIVGWLTDIFCNLK